MTALRIADGLALPAEAVTQTFALLAIRGKKHVARPIFGYNDGNIAGPTVRLTPSVPGRTNRRRRSVAVAAVYPEPSPETKPCTRCKRELSLDHFGFNFSKDRGKAYRRAHCRRCDVEKAATYRKTEAGKASRRREHERAYAGRKAWWAALRERISCTFCGESDYVALDFHHLDPDQKEFNIARMRGYSFRRMQAEVAKCVCLCANCHRKLHAGRFVLPAGVPSLAATVAEIGR